METENKYIPGRRNYLIALAPFMLAFMVYYSIMMISAPGRKTKALTEEFGYKPDEKNKIDERIFTDSAYLKLLKEKAFHQSRITMAETDSIYLTINLPDSTIDLEISGVSVHSSSISRINISKIIRMGNEYIISTLFSRPFNISRNFSSIKKEPLVIKMAPKDTSEFKPDIILDTADYEPVNFIMEADNGTRIYVYQQEKLHPGDRMHRFIFDMRFRVRNFLNSFKSICVFKIPEYHPFIKIRIPRADAKIIYRALPEHGQIAVYM